MTNRLKYKILVTCLWIAKRSLICWEIYPETNLRFEKSMENTEARLMDFDSLWLLPRTRNTPFTTHVMTTFSLVSQVLHFSSAAVQEQIMSFVCSTDPRHLFIASLETSFSIYVRYINTVQFFSILYIMVFYCPTREEGGKTGIRDLY